MDSVIEFMKTEPLVGLIALIVICYAITRPFRYAFEAYNRKLRSKNIAAHGWPPEYLDADGDFKEED